MASIMKQFATSFAKQFVPKQMVIHCTINIETLTHFLQELHVT
jgi:hypothetical protein